MSTERTIDGRVIPLPYHVQVARARRFAEYTKRARGRKIRQYRKDPDA